MVADDRGKRELTAYVKATEVQNKMLGLDAPTKLELTGKDGGNLKVEIKPLPAEWLQPK